MVFRNKNLRTGFSWYYWHVTASMLTQRKELGNICMYMSPCVHTRLYLVSTYLCIYPWLCLCICLHSYVSICLLMYLCFHLCTCVFTSHLAINWVHADTPTLILCQRSHLAFSFCLSVTSFSGFPGGSVVKNPPANAGDLGSIPGSSRSPGEGNVNSLQDICLENPMDRGAWWVTVHGVTEESETT